jgi:hypothetical protein
VSALDGRPLCWPNREPKAAICKTPSRFLPHPSLLLCSCSLSTVRVPPPPSIPPHCLLRPGRDPLAMGRSLSDLASCQWPPHCRLPHVPHLLERSRTTLAKAASPPDTTRLASRRYRRRPPGRRWPSRPLLCSAPTNKKSDGKK